MGRLNKGSVNKGADGLFHGRVRWTDEVTLKARDKKFPPQDTKTKATKLVEAFKKDLDKGGTAFVDAEKMTFAVLAKTYQETKLVPATFRRGKKISGVKSLRPALANLNALVKHFGARKVRTITHADIVAYMHKRTHTRTIHNKEREVSSVNREVELLRAIFNFSVQNGWLARSRVPFELGGTLISKGDENSRERVLGQDEEIRLLAVCTGKRAHLQPLLIVALDTAMRRGELFKLKWKDVDLASRTISVLAENAKTARRREVPMTDRVQDELMRMWEASPKKLTDSVFGYDKPNSTCKTALAAALKEAGIKDFRFHDCRHTATTRMEATGMPATTIMKISGHSQYKTFARYVNPPTDAILKVADALSAMNTAAKNQAVASSNNQAVASSEMIQ